MVTLLDYRHSIESLLCNNTQLDSLILRRKKRNTFRLKGISEHKNYLTFKFERWCNIDIAPIYY